MSKLILPDGFKRYRTHDAMTTYDSKTVDSTGVFLIGELERLDQTLHMPLSNVSWSRDIDLREDVSIADETSSFTNSSFAAAGGGGQEGISWIGKDTDAIAGIALDIGKTSQPLNLWGMQVGWTLPELASAQQAGRPVDVQKFEGLQLKYQMDVDQIVYVGDKRIGTQGLLNSDRVTVTNVINGASGTSTWATKTEDEILADIDELLNTAWFDSAYARCPTKVLLPPKLFSLIVRRKVSQAGNISLIKYLQENSICNSINSSPLDIQPLKWLTGAGVSGRNRMVAYTQDKTCVRFPLVPLQRTPLEYRDIRQLTTYFGRLGVVEFVYPETVAYADGI